jgi:hypothetical protein
LEVASFNGNFCHHKITLAIWNIKIINLAMRWQQNVEQTLTEKKVASVASLNQLVQHEKKKA